VWIAESYLDKKSKDNTKNKREKLIMSTDFSYKITLHMHFIKKKRKIVLETFQSKAKRIWNKFGRKEKNKF
jgi:hypothetical protein